MLKKMKERERTDKNDKTIECLVCGFGHAAGGSVAGRGVKADGDTLTNVAYTDVEFTYKEVGGERVAKNGIESIKTVAETADTATIVKGSENAVTWSAGWYVVSGTVTIYGGGNGKR